MAVDTLTFDIAPELLPAGLCGVYFVLAGVTNQKSEATFENYKNQRLQELLTTLTPQFLSIDPILQGYRELHIHFGFSNRNFPAAPETLLENLLRYHHMAHVNLLVDIYNLVSLETHLALGAHDVSAINGDIHLRPMHGDENFWPLGSPEPKKVRSGGYSYIDDANDMLCMLDSRQVEKTKVTEATKDIFYILQGNARTPLSTLRRAAERLVELTQQYCGGEVRYLYP